MAFFGLFDKLVYIEFPSPAGIKRASASIYFNAEAAKLFDMGKQLPADVLLIGFRQARNLVDSFLHYFGHI
jgi:hypothetical protein